MSRMKELRDAMIYVWAKIPEEATFHWRQFEYEVRELIDFDPDQDTMKRQFRQFRQDGIIFYECIDRKTSFYKKLSRQPKLFSRGVEYVN